MYVCCMYTCLFHSPMLHSVARMLVIHCITVYKQQSPSLHRQHYCAIWCVGVMSCTLSCLPARPLPSNRHYTYRIVQNTELKAKKYREGNRMCRLTIIAVTVAAWCTDKVKEEKLRIGTQPVGWETSLHLCLGGRRPLCDVIANGVLQISVVREAGKITIYMLHHGTL